MGENKEKLHFLKPSCGSWDVETGGRSVEEVVNFIKGFDASGISRAATAYKDAHTTVKEAREAILAEAEKLAKVWEGEASVEAQTALFLLYKTMGELSTKLNAMHRPIQALSTVVTKHQEFIDDTWKGVMPTWANQSIGTWNDSIADIYSVYTGYFGNGSDGPLETINDNAETDFGSQDELAGLHLQTFANDLSHINSAIPDTLQKTLRDIQPPQLPQDGPQQVTYPTGDPGRTPGFNPPPYDGSGLNGGPHGYVSTDGPTFGEYDPSGYITDPVANPEGSYTDGPNPDGTNPGGPNPGDIPGGPQHPGGVNPPGATSGQPVTPADLNRTTNGGDPRTSLADYNPNAYSPTNTANPTTPGYTPTSYTPGTSGGGTGTGGGGLAPAQATSLGTRAGTGTGMPFLPMGGAGGAGGGGESRDRESTTWLHEDDDVWGDDTTSVNSTIA